MRSDFHGLAWASGCGRTRARQLDDKGPDPHPDTGPGVRDIVRVAAKRAIDLIVMSSHRVRPGRPGAGWGTTSYKVGVFCRCPKAR
jgi:hypothetical protein